MRGGGKRLKSSAQIAISVDGVDPCGWECWRVSVANKRLIAEGRVHVDRALVSQLPFPGDMFDVVTAIETNTTGRM